jgi:hypothetical protein
MPTNARRAVPNPRICPVYMQLKNVNIMYRKSARGIRLLLSKHMLLVCYLQAKTGKTQGRAAAPVLLALAVGVAILPLVISQGEEDGLLADLEEERGNGSSLLGLTSAGDTVAGTGGRPASLEDTGLLAGADSVDNVKLATDEGTSISSDGLRVEVSVGLGTDNVNDIAESISGGGLLPDADGVGGGEGTSVTRELGLALGDEAGELRCGTVSVEDGLVSNDDQIDEVPLSPLLDGADLLRNGGVVGSTVSSVNVDTKDHLHAVGRASGTNVGQSVAVSRVDTDGGDTVSSDGGNVLSNSRAGLAASIGVVGGVGDGPGSNTVTGQASGSGRRAGAGLGGSSGGGNNRGGGVDGDSGRSGGGSGGGGGNVKWAVDDGVGLNNGGHNLGLGVSAGAVGADNGDNDRGGRSHGGGGGSNGVSTSRGADVGGSLNDAGGNAVAGRDGGVGAGHGGGGLHDGGDTSQGVSAGGDRGGRGGAHGGCLSQSNRGGGEGVDTRGRASLGHGSRHNDWRRRGRRGSSGHGLGAAGSDAAGGGGDAAGAGRRRVVDYGDVLTLYPMPGN